MLSSIKFQPSTRQLIRAGIADETKAFTGPEHVVIDLTNRCNNSCIACWTHSPLLGKAGPDPAWHKQELDLGRTLDLIDELYRMGTAIIRFTGGGEPFMHSGIYTLIRAVKSRGMFCAVTTNLTLVDPETATELVATGLDELAVSLWASNPDEYAKTHPNQPNSTFERITAVLKHIHRLRRVKSFPSPLRLFRRPTPRINILNVICNLNHKSIESMFDYALETGADSIYFTVVDTIEGSTDCLLLSDEQRKEAKEACDSIRQKNDHLPRRQRITLDNFSGFETRLAQEPARYGNYDQNAVDSIPCYIGWIFCRIMADGHVAPCCRGVDIPMGNINESSFAEIWYSTKYDFFRRKAKNSKKSDLYFRKVGCQKTCDNLMHNLEVHNWLETED